MKKQMGFIAISAMLLLAGCGGNAGNDQDQAVSMEDHGEHSEMNHSSSGEVPEGLEKAANPKYKVEEEAQITSDHMPGMEGAEATISGAYNTTVYTVSYTPTNGGERVTNHKWVIQEELEDAGSEPLTPGTEVVLEADHMEGMKGAQATIDSAEQTTVYMVDFTPTTGGERVTNHKWVTESELTSL